MAISKTQIDRLGDRLKKGSHTESDLRLLDDYRRSFGEAYEAVVGKLRQRGASPTGRLAKSTMSVAEKLRRESLRLSQMQDIAGCRVIVSDVLEQDQFVAGLKSDFSESILSDRRESPSNGYRAVHVIVKVGGKLIEIQVRTAFQHLWAEVSEKSSDVLDPTIKYGGGDQRWQNFLATSSKSVASFEEFEKKHAEAERLGKIADSSFEKFKRTVTKMRKRPLSEPKLEEYEKLLKDLAREKKHRAHDNKAAGKKLAMLRKVNADLLTKAIADLDQRKGEKQ